MKCDRLNQLSTVLTGHGVLLAFLFGSQAGKGEALLKGSPVKPADDLADLDLGVVLRNSLPDGLARARFYALLYNDLVDLFRPLNLDLVLLQETHSIFQLEAIKGICVYRESEQAKEDYEMSVLRRAADFGPVLAKFLEETLEEV